ncbi:MAG: hypothetical protein LLG14_24810 [Nocardiaceae bacterium]|nr:hypothetical protein [Nocardiaceae bacterium]
MTDCDNERWWAAAESEAIRLANLGTEWTFDDIRRAVPCPPCNDNLAGALISSLKARDVIERARGDSAHVSSVRSRNHGLQRYWRGVPATA